MQLFIQLGTLLYVLTRNILVGMRGLEPLKEWILSPHAVPFATIPHARYLLYITYDSPECQPIFFQIIVE